MLTSVFGTITKRYKQRRKRSIYFFDYYCALETSFESFFFCSQLVRGSRWNHFPNDLTAGNVFPKCMTNISRATFLSLFPIETSIWFQAPYRSGWHNSFSSFNPVMLLHFSSLFIVLFSNLLPIIICSFDI